MRASLILAGSALGVLVAVGAAAQDVPSNPPEAPSPPAEPTNPPTEPAPPTPPAPPPTPPPVVLPETPEPPPSKPAKKEVKAADVTLEETPEESGTRGRPKPGAQKKRKPKAEPAAEPEPEPPVEAASPATHEHANGETGTEESPEGDEEKSKDDKSKKDDGEGLLGPFRIGIILGTGLPSIVSFGGMIKLTRYFGAGVNIGLIPAIRLSLYGEADLSYQEYDLYGRIFPFGGALFAGAGVGYAHAGGTLRGSYDVTPVLKTLGPLPPGVVVPNPLTVGSDASVRVMVLTPTIGLLHTFGSGFTIGVDVGAQIPIAPSETRFETAVPASLPLPIKQQYVDPNDQQVRDTLDKMSRTIIPTLNLRIGWLL